MRILYRTVIIAIALLGAGLLFVPLAAAQEADSVVDTLDPDITWRIIEFPYVQRRPFQLGLELYLGVGDHGNIAQTRPADSVPFPLGTFGGWALVRLRMYCGPLGLVNLLDIYADGMLGGVTEGEYQSDATSTSYQMLASFPLELGYFRFRIEPYLGYGWLTDWAETREPRNYDLVYRESFHGKGLVWGWEQIVRLGSGYQVRGIYTFGDYELHEKRLKVEVQYSSDALPKSEFSNLDKRRGVGFASLGILRSWKGDKRKDFMIYIGIGFRVRL